MTATAMLFFFLIAALQPTDSSGQSVSQTLVIREVASDIALEPGKLLGIGPLADSAKTVMPNRIAVDTGTICLAGPDKCQLSSPNATRSLQLDFARKIGGKLLSSEVASVESKNRSTYQLSEVIVNGDDARVTVVMWWTDWVKPNYPHQVVASYILGATSDGKWRIVRKGHPGNEKDVASTN